VNVAWTCNDQSSGAAPESSANATPAVSNTAMHESVAMAWLILEFRHRCPRFVVVVSCVSLQAVPYRYRMNSLPVEPIALNGGFESIIDSHNAKYPPLASRTGRLSRLKSANARRDSYDVILW